MKIMKKMRWYGLCHLGLQVILPAATILEKLQASFVRQLLSYLRL